MTLDNAIKFTEERSQNLEYFKYSKYYDQLSNWLKEVKFLRKRRTMK